jgi:putative transposase
VSIAYTEHLASAGIRASIGTVGDNYDNALAEAVDGLYKAELIHARPAWPSMTEVEFGTLRCVHWWNTERLHENPDYQTPAEVKAPYYETRARAAALV